MSVETTGRRALQLARDREISDAVARIAAAEPDLERLCRNPNLDAVRDLTVGELVVAVLNGGERRKRHLTPVPTPRAAAGTWASLSDREFGVVRLIVEGLSNKEIGLRLELSEKTVKNHISHILRKLKLRARTQVAVLALRGGVF